MSAASTTASGSKPSKDFDIGAVIAAPLKDPQWLQKCLVIGLMSMIPIVGALNMSGWTRTITENKLNGITDLPEASLSYIGKGWKLFLAWLPVAGLIWAATIIFIGLTFATVAMGNGKPPEAVLMLFIFGFYAFILAFSLAISVLAPAVNFLHIVDGEPWASAAFRRLWGVVRDGGIQYLLLFLAIMVAGIIAQLGVLAFFVGIFISLPFSQAIQGFALAEYNRVLRTKPEPSINVDGGIGGASGSPFGVKL